MDQIHWSSIEDLYSLVYIFSISLHDTGSFHSIICDI